MSQFTLALIEALKDKTVSESLSKSLTIQVKPLIEQIDDLKQHVIRLEQKIQQTNKKTIKFLNLKIKLMSSLQILTILNNTRAE